MGKEIIVDIPGFEDHISAVNILARRVMTTMNVPLAYSPVFEDNQNQVFEDITQLSGYTPPYITDEDNQNQVKGKLLLENVDVTNADILAYEREKEELITEAARFGLDESEFVNFTEYANIFPSEQVSFGFSSNLDNLDKVIKNKPPVLLDKLLGGVIKKER